LVWILGWRKKNKIMDFYIQPDNGYVIVRETGNVHNMLGICLSDKPESSVMLVGLNSDNFYKNKLDEKKIMRQVLMATSDIYAEFEKRFFIKKIQYVKTDSPPESIYRYLAFEILRSVVLNIEPKSEIILKEDNSDQLAISLL
jgi:hypothetical protein